MFLVKKKIQERRQKVTSSLCRGKTAINPESSFEDGFQELGGIESSSQ